MHARRTGLRLEVMNANASENHSRGVILEDRGPRDGALLSTQNEVLRRLFLFQASLGAAQNLRIWVKRAGTARGGS